MENVKEEVDASGFFTDEALAIKAIQQTALGVVRKLTTNDKGELVIPKDRTDAELLASMMTTALQAVKTTSGNRLRQAQLKAETDAREQGAALLRAIVRPPRPANPNRVTEVETGSTGYTPLPGELSEGRVIITPESKA